MRDKHEEVMRIFSNANKLTLGKHLMQYYQYSKEEEAYRKTETAAVVKEFKSQCSPHSYLAKVDKISKGKIVGAMKAVRKQGRSS